MKKILLAIVLHICAVTAFAQPAGYYNSAFGNTGQSLRVALYQIIRNHTVLNYGGSSLPNTWTTFQTSDVKANGKVWDIYSDIPGGAAPYEFTFVTDQCGNYNGESDCYNHEHTWPQSYFNSNAPMKSDLFHIYPTDGFVNGKRSNYQYGVVTNPSWTSRNGSKLGNNTYTGAPSTTAFEPLDSFKGDIARTYFYMTTRYYSEDADWQTWEMAAKAELSQWAINMLLDWHHKDPVSKKEIDRNNAIYAAQNNRNPFIDIPQFADCIWLGNCTGLSTPDVAMVNAGIRCFPTNATTDITIDWAQLSPDEVLAIDVHNMQGQLIYHKDISVQQNRNEQLSVSEWQRGIYTLRVNTRHGTQVRKIVLQ